MKRLRDIYKEAAKANMARVWNRYTQRPAGHELHHVFGRDGFLKACMLFMEILTKEEHDNPEVISNLREMYREQYNEVCKKNFKGYCTEVIEDCCYNCALLRQGGTSDIQNRE